jgi:hypothetical protein
MSIRQERFFGREESKSVGVCGEHAKLGFVRKLLFAGARDAWVKTPGADLVWCDVSRIARNGHSSQRGWYDPGSGPPARKCPSLRAWRRRHGIDRPRPRISTRMVPNLSKSSDEFPISGDDPEQHSDWGSPSFHSHRNAKSVLIRSTDDPYGWFSRIVRRSSGCSPQRIHEACRSLKAQWILSILKETPR